MNILPASRLTQVEGLALYEKGVHASLHLPVEQKIERKLGWLNIVSAINVDEGFMEVGIMGENNFCGFLLFDDYNHWDLSDEQLTLLGGMAERLPSINRGRYVPGDAFRPKAERSSASFDAKLHVMAQMAVDLEAAA